MSIKLLELIEDHDDVQHVWSDMDVDEKELEALAKISEAVSESLYLEESLEAIGEALAENGKVIVTGCLGAKDDVILAAHPQVLVTANDHRFASMEMVKAVPKDEARSRQARALGGAPSALRNANCRIREA